MLIKFFKNGKGSGKAPIDYLLRREGRETFYPEVLWGEPERTKELIDNVNHTWRYTSGVISFALEDRPTEEQQILVMNEFEQLAFAGLDTDQYDILWVRHQHTKGGRVELHFVIPRVELLSGKSLNVAPPRWKHSYAPLRDFLNLKYGWACPNDSDRRRLTQVVNESTLRGKDRKSISFYLEKLIEDGAISNRHELIIALEDAGLEVTRRGKDYITVKDVKRPDQKGFRLKGAIYESDWTREQQAFKETCREFDAGANSERGRIKEAQRRLKEVTAKRTSFHKERYGRNEGDYQTVDGRHQRECRRGDNGNQASNKEITRDTRGADIDNTVPSSGRGVNSGGSMVSLGEQDDRNQKHRSSTNGIKGESEGTRGGKYNFRSGEGAKGQSTSEEKVRNEPTNSIRERIIEIVRDASRRYLEGYRELTKWFTRIQGRRVEAHRNTLEISRRAHSEHRKHVEQHLERIGRANGKIRDANDGIKQFIEKINLEIQKRRRSQSKGWSR